MHVLEVSGVRIASIVAAIPKTREDTLARCTALYGSEERARSVVESTGIVSRAIASPGTTSLDLCVAAAEKLFADTAADRGGIAAVVSVTFTPERRMPGNAALAQARLGLPNGIAAIDLDLACAGWAYGLWTAASLVKATGRSALLLDGDVQTPCLGADDAATVPILSDAGTATLIVPDAAADPWRFAFFTDGARAEALTLPAGGTLRMDGFEVFKFVATDVQRFLKEFLAETGTDGAALAAFAPHQANVYMIRQLAKALGLDGKLLVSADELGNCASASVPVTLARNAASLRGGSVLVAGFGGGLSASAALLPRIGGDRMGVLEL